MNGKILIIYDDPSHPQLLRKYLSDSTYEILSTDNHTEALSIMASEAPSIVIISWMMAETNGLQLCRAIRSAAEGIGIVYIIILTTQADQERMSEAFKAGANDYLTAPCSRYELLARIRTGEQMLQLLHQQREHAAALEGATSKAEEALRELEHVHSQLLQADKMASIGQLAAGVAHEINNPIGFISSNLNSLGNYMRDLKRVLKAHEELMCLCLHDTSTASPKAAEIKALWEEADVDYIISDIEDLITESVEGTHRVRQIVADLRDFSHVDNPDVSEEDINKLLDKTINVAWNELKYKTEVVREYGQISMIPCYGGKLGQVFLNLLVNSAQAIDERGTITVRTGEEDGHIRIEVSDTGRGIPSENLNRIFEPFFTTKEVGKGTGMGLHLAYKIVKAHGGRIAVESVVGKGTTFQIDLPVAGASEIWEKRDGAIV